VSPTLTEERADHEDITEKTFDFVSKLDNSYLPVQGPPGAGKSFTGSHLIVKLVEEGKKIGITALSHKVISNLLTKVWEVAEKQELSIQMLQKVKSEYDELVPWQVTTGEDTIQAALGKADVIAGTSFMWSKP